MAFIDLPIFVSPPKPGASVGEIKQWIKSLDTNEDGKISNQELQYGLRHLNLCFTHFRARRGMKMTDLNGNGYIDTPAEFKELESYVQKHWGHKITLAA
ncbi:hypothetical protein ACLOJK_020897 [Asimina triloba]